MPTRNLLYARQVPITEKISVVIPTVGEILDDEDGYYWMVQMITQMPVDMMAQLDDIGIDFTTITDYDLFIMTFNTLRQQDTSLIFGDLDLSKFEAAISESSGDIVLLDCENDIRIDKGIFRLIAQTLRMIHHLDKTKQTPGNDEAKEFMIERARKKLARQKGRTTDSQLESLIVSMVNTEQFKYGFEGTRELSIYQFNESVRQIINKVDYDNRMFGVYSGTISTKDLSQDDLNWLTHK